jgi:hypothetical protein
MRKPRKTLAAPVLLLALLTSTFAAILAAQATSSIPSPTPTPSTASFDATALVRRALQHRAEADARHRPLRYLLHKTEQRHGVTQDTTKDVIETRDGDVARLVAINGRPLSAPASRAELDRLNYLAAHPKLQEHRHKSEQRDAAHINHLMALLPYAFLYRLEATAPCAPGQCYQLSFTPNPHFNPPDLEADVLRGIAGELWIDQAQERLTLLDARFIEDVDFGFGILGKINKGGTLLLEQTDVGGHDWELTTFKLNLTGKALILHSVQLQVTEEASHFSQVPPGLTYRDAIQLLKRSSPYSASSGK